VPEFIGGLPVHALLVHFTVVLIVLAVAGAVLTAVWPAVRRRFGWLVFAVAAVGTLLVPFTTKSGENLAGRISASGDTAARINEHERLGDLMIWWAVGLTVAVGLLMVVHTMAERKVTSRVAVGAAGAEEEVPQEAGRAPVLVAIVLALVTVGVAVGAGIHVYRVGDAGARAVWEGVENLPAQNGG
jgi:uncharacterized membrane protein